MAPPDLTGDVPVRRVLERLDCEAMLRLGVVADAAATQRVECWLLQLRHRAPPLQRDPRLDPAIAAVAERDRMAVRLALLELAVLLEPREHAPVRVVLCEAGEIAGVVVHPAVRADDGQLRKPVVPADLVVERIVPRGHLQRAGPELALDPFVGDHRDTPLDERDDDLLPDEPSVAVVVGMHRNCHVGEHRRRPHGGDRDVAGAVGDRIAHIRECVVDVDVRELEIGERRQVERAPVDDPVRAIDPALAVQVHEEAHDGAHVRLVHREALAPVVE